MNFEKIPGIWFTVIGVVYLSGLVAALLFAPWGFVGGFVFGGALVTANAWASARKVKRAEFLDKGREIASLMGGFYVRLILLGLCLFVMIKFLNVDPVGLVTGLSVVPVGLFVMLILIYVANRRPEEA